MITLPKVEERSQSSRNTFPVLYWNHVALELNRLTHSLGGPQGGPTMSSRALGLLHLAMHDAFFATVDPALLGGKAHRPYLAALPQGGAGGSLAAANEALTGAAITVLDRMYRTMGAGISVVANDTLVTNLGRLIGEYADHIDVLSAHHRRGVDVAGMILDKLAVKPGEPGADAGRYEPRQGRYYFRDEPSHPVRTAPIDPNDPSRGTHAVRVYHGPFYGSTVATFAVSDEQAHRIAPPPVGPANPNPSPKVYVDALDEVVKLGGAPNLRTTTRTADDTVGALFWAYDGANLIGTPPRLYNQIIREVAWGKLPAPKDAGDAGNHADLVRVFALCNAAMADAGKFAWLEKYHYEFWRPLSGVREHDDHSGPEAQSGAPHIDAHADPFWLAFGAPDTNSNSISFKPPFPAYPSGHATFGAACFQMLRLFYGVAGKNLQEADHIGFELVSDELNGISRELYQPFDPAKPLEDQPGLVRTRIVRRFDSLWDAIFENAFSRIWLGVHWSFDAFDPANAAGKHKTPGKIRYDHVWGSNRQDKAKLPMGGVPLGLGIANDIYASGLVEQSKPAGQMAAAPPQAHVKATNTTFRP